MSENEKNILNKAMKKIEVPQEESLAALETGSNQKRRYHKSQYKWGEIIISSLVVVSLFFIGALLWPKSEKTTEPAGSNQASNQVSNPTATSSEVTENSLQATKYWKVQNEEDYYSFQNGEVRMIIKYFTQAELKYEFKENQLNIFHKEFDESNNLVEVVHSYQVKAEGANLALEPKTAEDKRIVLEPQNEEIFPYTEETIKKLKPAINPDLSSVASWTSSIKGNGELHSTLTFDGFLRKERIDGEESWMTTTYEVKNNHILINYGSYTIGLDMYWDGDNIVLWRVSSTLPESDDKKEYNEETVEIMKPNK